VGTDQITNLFADGVCKVNILTILERDSASILFLEMLRNASKIIGSMKVKELQEQGLLGSAVEASENKSIQYYIQLYRQEILFEEIKKIVTCFISIWYF